MSTNPWQQLAETPIPPPPTTFNSSLHQQINKRLLTAHVLDLILRGIWYALGHFSKAMLGFVYYSITGQFQPRPPRRPGQSP